MLTTSAAPFVQLVQALARASTKRQVIDTLKAAARKLVGADGVTVVFLDGDKCFYVAEDAMAPLFSPGRFPMETCISGWVIQNAKPVTILDIYVDSRIPIEVYRPTFVKSMGMVPIRSEAPIGALGFYWADTHQMSADELEMAQALADTASVTLHNIEHQENLEQRVLERTEQLTLTNRDLHLFAGNVAHDLRSPLSVLQSNAQLLLEAKDLDEDERREILEDIQSSSNNMSMMLRGLLELSQVTSAPIHRGVVDLSAMAHDVARTLARAEPSRRVSLEIEPSLSANADEGLMRIAISNLMNNAWKYTSRRLTPVIRFTRQDTLTGPAFLVQDNGAGFDSNKAQLFSAFKRFHTANEFPGTGLGLTTVYRAIHRHGGAVWAESQRDAGARFFFQIPDAVQAAAH